MYAKETTVEIGSGGLRLEHDCGCGCGGDGSGCADGCGTCGSASERPRWFVGQLVGPHDLESLQQWVIGRTRRHNRMLHGWGVACGLAISVTTSQDGDPVPWSVTVDAGYGLTACGDEVCVPGPVRVDIRAPSSRGTDACGPPVDPWCAPVQRRREPDRTYYLAIRYAEESRRPVRVNACSCGCDDYPCEYSRTGETFTFAVLDELPDCYDDDPARVLLHEHGDPAEAMTCSTRIRRTGTRPCPECCSPWLVLADLRVDANGTVAVDPLTHRRFLASFGDYYFTCQPIRPQKVVVLSAAAREAIKTAFASNRAELAETARREAILAAPALDLRGATRSNALRDLIGDRTVTELANADVATLAAAGVGAGIDREAVEHLHALANLVTKIAGM